MFAAMRGVLLSVENLGVEFPRDGGSVRAASEVSFSIETGETVALVGESGCGKSATALALFRLVPPPGRVVSGRVVFEGTDLLPLPDEQIRRFRGAGLAWVPQEPGAALNPVLTIGSQVVDVIRAHRAVPRREAWDEAVDLLHRVGIPDPAQRAREYPHQLSGGHEAARAARDGALGAPQAAGRRRADDRARSDAEAGSSTCCARCATNGGCRSS